MPDDLSATIGQAKLLPVPPITPDGDMIPADVARALGFTTRPAREVTVVVPAAPGTPDAAEDATGAVFDPAFEAMAAMAEKAGWTPAEFAAAALGWALDRTAKEGGDAAAWELLDAAAEVMTMRGSGAG